MILYCIHDIKAETWSFPQTTNNEATAIREFERLAKNPSFPVADVELYKVADFDQSSAEISVGKRLILKGSDYVKG